MKRARVVKELCFQTAVVDALHRMVEEHHQHIEWMVDPVRRRNTTVDMRDARICKLMYNVHIDVHDACTGERDARINEHYNH